MALSDAEKKRKSRASKSSEYHDRERETSRKRMAISRARIRAKKRASDLRSILNEADRKRLDSIAFKEKQRLIQEWFRRNGLTFEPKAVTDDKILNTFMRKPDLHAIELQVAEFEISMLCDDDSEIFRPRPRAYGLTSPAVAGTRHGQVGAPVVRATVPAGPAWRTVLAAPPPRQLPPASGLTSLAVAGNRRGQVGAPVVHATVLAGPTWRTAPPPRQLPLTSGLTKLAVAGTLQLQKDIDKNIVKRHKIQIELQQNLNDRINRFLEKETATSVDNPGVVQGGFTKPAYSGKNGMGVLSERWKDEILAAQAMAIMQHR